MTCIHGLGSSVIDYVIYDIPLYNAIIDFDTLHNHKPDSFHRPLTITLNLSFHNDPIEENSQSQKHLVFDRNKVDGFLNDLMQNLFPLSHKANIEDLYHNFTTSLSFSIKKFSLEISTKNKDKRTNPWYDNECKHARREIKKSTNESLKVDKINKYKAPIKRKNTYSINKRQEKLLRLSKTDPKKLLRQILTCKTKENNKISLEDWNSYLKKLYESPKVVDNFQALLTTKQVFTSKDIKFGIKCLTNGKVKDIEGYQA